MSDIEKVYLSIPISRTIDASRIEEYLNQHGITVLNPCRLVHDNCPKEQIPSYVAEKCWKLIEESEAVILFYDYYGRDCSCEIGYAFKSSKPVFPFYLYHKGDFQEDWMIRSRLEPCSEGLDVLIDQIKKYVKRDADSLVALTQ